MIAAESRSSNPLLTLLQWSNRQLNLGFVLSYFECSGSLNDLSLPSLPLDLQTHPFNAQLPTQPTLTFRIPSPVCAFLLFLEWDLPRSMVDEPSCRLEALGQTF